MHSSGPLSIIHAEQDKIWVDSCAGVHPGDEVSQTSFTSDLCDLFQAFESFRSSLWNKHASVPDSQWDDIIGFAATQLRPMAPSQPAFTTNSVRRCLLRKTARSATGLDGRADLLALSDTDLGLPLRTFDLAGRFGTWPQQTLNGYVRSLAKNSDPQSVGHFRPITVFSAWYRTWSSVAARHWLAQLSAVVDPFLCGNAVGCRAGMVWRFVLEQVEAAHRDNVPICGFSADTVQCVATSSCCCCRRIAGNRSTHLGCLGWSIKWIQTALCHPWLILAWSGLLQRFPRRLCYVLCVYDDPHPALPSLAFLLQCFVSACVIRGQLGCHSSQCRPHAPGN